MARASSGSRSCISSVDPLISANKAVTVLRSPSRIATESTSAVTRSDETDFDKGVAAPVDALRSAAHSPQNFAVVTFSNPQLRQRFFNGAAHSLQNFSPSGFSAPQFEQCILKSFP